MAHSAPHFRPFYIYVRNAWCFQRNIERQLNCWDRCARTRGVCTRVHRIVYLLSHVISIYKLVWRVEVRAFIAYSWVKFIFQFYLSILLTRRTRVPRSWETFISAANVSAHLMAHGVLVASPSHTDMKKIWHKASLHRTAAGTGADVSVRRTLCTLITDM